MKLSKNNWACLSAALLLALFNLFIFILVELKTDKYSFSIAIIGNVLIFPPVMFFLNASGYWKKIWKFWKSQPTINHQLISLMAAFWLGALILKALPFAMKKEYEKE